MRWHDTEAPPSADKPSGQCGPAARCTDMPDPSIYADVCGSAQVSPKVLAMLDTFFSRNACANPNANHAPGLTLLERIERSRAEIATGLGADSDNILFNSGSSEGCAHIFYHFHAQNKGNDPLLLYSPIEHPCTLENIRRYQAEGISALTIPHQENGEIDLAVLRHTLEQHRGRPTLVCVMAAHNETGVIQPIKTISQTVKKYGASLFSDMTQAVGKMEIDLTDLNVDYAIASGHKFGALPGIGFLYVKHRQTFFPLILGGGQENASRGGTQNYLGIFSLAIALQEKRVLLKESPLRSNIARSRFEETIESLINDACIIGKQSDRIPFVTFLAFRQTNGKKLQAALNRQGIYTATGSACSDKKSGLSATVLALGLGNEMAANTLRISISDDDADEVYARICAGIEQTLRPRPTASPRAGERNTAATSAAGGEPLE